MNQKNKFYITTAIPYVNDQPHLGHAMEFIQADVVARYHRTLEEATCFLTGTDEHGQKNYQTAAAKGLPVAKFTAQNSLKFKALLQLLNVSNDYFIKTTSLSHKKAAGKIWLACQKDIYKSKYSGLYCVGHERFMSQRELASGMCPEHNTAPQKLTLDSYFFALSRYQKQVEELIKSDQLKIFPELRKNEILQFVKKGLEDVSISRPKTQLPWGVDVPGDPAHVMYVWFDALTNYISAIGYADDEALFKKWWPADLHIVGKDILRFHATMWPGMLLSAGLAVPKAIYAHSFINAAGGAKMSKSLGNATDPVKVVEAYSADALRYYLLRYIPSGSDGEFSLEHFAAIYDADLANDLGNLVARVAAMIGRYLSGKYHPAAKLTELKNYGALINECKFDVCLKAIFEQVSQLNKSIESSKPWLLARDDQAKTDRVLSTLAARIVQVSQYLQPFLPDTAEKIQQIFKNGKVVARPPILFPKLDDAR